MKTYKEFLNEEGKGYVALLVTRKSKDKIKKVLAEYGLTDIINKLHLTLIFDNANPAIDTDNDSTYNAEVSDIEMLGELDSPWRAVVFRLNDTELNARFKSLQSLGFKHSFDEFKPHVSIIYGPSKEEIKVIMDNKDDIIKAISSVELNSEYSEYNEKIDKPDPKSA